MNKQKYNIKKEDLKNYLKKGKTYIEIAKIYNCSNWTIMERVKEYKLNSFVMGKITSKKGDKNPAKRKIVRKKISKSVKKLWQDNIYNERVNGMIGKNGWEHPNYKGYKWNYAEFLSRFQDIKKCSICGKKDKKINIHHIDENHDNWLITNLIPICVTCHQSFHFKRYITPFQIITRRFTLESCHKLIEYKGACQFDHGHSYQLYISIRKRINPKTGMIMDYKDLKQIVNKIIIDKLDHKNLNEIIPCKTTAENMCIWIWEELEQKGLLKGLHQIRLFETENSECILSVNDMIDFYKQSKI